MSRRAKKKTQENIMNISLFPGEHSSSWCHIIIYMLCIFSTVAPRRLTNENILRAKHLIVSKFKTLLRFVTARNVKKKICKNIIVYFNFHCGFPYEHRKQTEKEQHGHNMNRMCFRSHLSGHKIRRDSIWNYKQYPLRVEPFCMILMMILRAFVHGSHAEDLDFSLLYCWNLHVLHFNLPFSSCLFVLYSHIRTWGHELSNQNWSNKVCSQIKRTFFLYSFQKSPSNFYGILIMHVYTAIVVVVVIVVPTNSKQFARHRKEERKKMNRGRF